MYVFVVTIRKNVYFLTMRVNIYVQQRWFIQWKLLTLFKHRGSQHLVRNNTGKNNPFQTQQQKKLSLKLEKCMKINIL